MWLGCPVNVLNNVIPILILVLGMADGVHLAGHLKESDHSAYDTVARIGPPCALTALTTALAFACIMLTSNAQLFEFEVLGALGTSLAFVVFITTCALLAQVIRPSHYPTPKFANAFASGLTRLSMARLRVLIVAASALLAVSVVGYQQTKAWFPLYQNLPQGSATVQVNEAIARDFGGVFQMIVDVKGEWADTMALLDKLTQIACAEAMLSNAALARWLGLDRAPTLEDLADSLTC